MIFESLINRGSMPVLQQVMSFTEARQQVLANNISNFEYDRLQDEGSG